MNSSSQALDLWHQLRPADPVDAVIFFQVDPVWWRLMAQPGLVAQNAEWYFKFCPWCGCQVQGSDPSHGEI